MIYTICLSYTNVIMHMDYQLKHVYFIIYQISYVWVQMSSIKYTPLKNIINVFCTYVTIYKFSEKQRKIKLQYIGDHR